MRVTWTETDETSPHTVSVVIPVYRGELTLATVVTELLAVPSPWGSTDGHRIEVAEILLIWDNGPDNSAAVIRQLAADHPQVRPVWLSRNFGQHAATLAGMASSGGDWIVTLDEDGQHDPRFIADMLDVAMATGAPVVYAEPTNPAPHGWFRNAASKTAKRTVAVLSGGKAPRYQSFRLVLGEIGRSVAAYAGSGVYLDVALGWVAGRDAVCPVTLRRGGERPSGYTFRSLLSHYWSLVVSSGTRALRMVSAIGVIFAILGLAVAAWLLISSLAGTQQTVRGWASTIVVILVTSGTTLFSLGVIAEYLGVAVNMAMGKPLYLIVSDPSNGPLGRRRRSPS
jgi:undecaprenyl-phosphate 4-deoxy-4-formamido-L-arabinose transferase